MPHDYMEIHPAKNGYWARCCVCGFALTKSQLHATLEGFYTEYDERESGQIRLNFCKEHWDWINRVLGEDFSKAINRVEELKGGGEINLTLKNKVIKKIKTNINLNAGDLVWIRDDIVVRFVETARWVPMTDEVFISSNEVRPGEKIGLVLGSAQSGSSVEVLCSDVVNLYPDWKKVEVP